MPLIGWHHLEESKRKMSETHKGKCTWNKGLTKETDSRLCSMGFTGPHSEEARTKMAKARRGLWQNPEYIVKMRKRYPGAGRAGTHHSEELRQRLKELNRRVGPQNGMYGKHHTPATKAKLSLAMKERNQDPEYKERNIKARLKGLFTKPTKPEKKLMAIIADNKLSFKYVGNGKLILGNKCPDFLNTNGKKQLIELFGTYWHDILDVARRTEHFRQYGFDTLVIWEDELENKQAVVKKIKKFNKLSSLVRVIMEKE